INSITAWRRSCASSRSTARFRWRRSTSASASMSPKQNVEAVEKGSPLALTGRRLSPILSLPRRFGACRDAVADRALRPGDRILFANPLDAPKDSDQSKEQTGYCQQRDGPSRNALLINKRSPMPSQDSRTGIAQDQCNQAENKPGGFVQGLPACFVVA